jgi:hypothetical protein
VRALESACKLYHDYDVDLFCVVLSLDFMRKIADLEDQLSVLTALSPRPMLR